MFGIGTALVLDEFALILHLDDVYWAEEGRLSVDAVAIATGVTGLLLLGGAPLLDDLTSLQGQGSVVFVVSLVLVLSINLALAAVTLLKGKLLDRTGRSLRPAAARHRGHPARPAPVGVGPEALRGTGWPPVGPTSWPRRSAGRSGTANRSSG